MRYGRELTHPDDLGYELRYVIRITYLNFAANASYHTLHSRFALCCVLLLLGNGWFYPYPSGLLNWRWTIIRLPNSRDANVKNVGKEIMWICRTLASPNHNKARQNISFYLHNINNWRAHESRMNCYSNNNKTKLNKTICISYGMFCVCSNGPIRSQRSLLLTWSPFHDFSQ